LVLSAALGATPAISQENDRHGGSWSISLSALYGFGQHVSGPGAAVDAHVYRAKWWGLDLQAGGLGMTGPALNGVGKLAEVRGWASGLFRVWLPLGWVRLEAAAGPAAIIEQDASATGRGFGGGIGLHAEGGVSLAATKHVDVFARGMGQLSGGGTSADGTNTFWVVGAVFGVQARFD
jgi:hypothetical protein